MKDIATKMLQTGSVNNDSVQLWNLQVRNMAELWNQGGIFIYLHWVPCF